MTYPEALLLTAAALVGWFEWWRGVGEWPDCPQSTLLATIERAALVAPPAPFHLTPRAFQEMHNAG